jgi:hypothetical protein
VAWKDQVTKTSATIIDFSAYKANKRARAELSRVDVCSTAPYGAVVSFFFVWPFLAWMPFGLLYLAAAEQETS